METVKVKIVDKSGHGLPHYQTEGSAGMDIRARLDAPVVIAPGERKMLPTGLFIELPQGYEAQIRPRSGMAFKHGLTVLNSPGTIDSDYRGEIKVLLINHSAEPYTVEDGTRIAQMVVAAHSQVEWQPAEALSETERGTGGYGSTGAK